MKRHISGSIIFILGMLVICEILLRLLLGLGNSPPYEPSGEYGYRFKPNQRMCRFSCMWAKHFGIKIGLA